MELRPEENESEDPAKLQILNRQLSMDSGTLLRRAHRNKPISGVGLVNYRAGYCYRYRKELSIKERVSAQISAQNSLLRPQFSPEAGN